MIIKNFIILKTKMLKLKDYQIKFIEQLIKLEKEKTKVIILKKRNRR